ncbi:unnamed protein product [Lasius platythorax]|uniref:Uncharacterized protein n=1 Tax=Lasius platythorax TaxID=488582 RepID=A0AAV2N3Z2_9HYME
MTWWSTNGDKRWLLTTLEFEISSKINIDRRNYRATRSINVIDKFSSRSCPDVISSLEHATLESTNGRQDSRRRYL